MPDSNSGTISGKNIVVQPAINRSSFTMNYILET